MPIVVWRKVALQESSHDDNPIVVASRYLLFAGRRPHWERNLSHIMVFAAARPRLGWLWDHRRRHHHHHSDHGHCLANNADDRVPCMCQPASRQSVNKSNIASHCFCSFLLIVRPKKRKHAIGSKTRQDRDPEELLPGGRLLRRLGSGADEGTIHRRLIFPHYIYECLVACVQSRMICIQIRRLGPFPIPNLLLAYGWLVAMRQCLWCDILYSLGKINFSNQMLAHKLMCGQYGIL